jgi:starvation-inducible DNA-binding protein
MRELVTALGKLLADVYAMSLMAQGAHWNVEGDDFHQFHEFFGEIYDDVYSAVDPLAENIRKLGAYSPAGLSTFAKLTVIKDTAPESDPERLCEELLSANDKVIRNIDVAFKAAVSANEQGIANFLSDRDGMHKKWRWQLTAITS